MRTLFFRISSSNYLIAIHFLLFHTLFSMSETQSFMARMLKITEYSIIAVLLWRLDLRRCKKSSFLLCLSDMQIKRGNNFQKVYLQIAAQHSVVARMLKITEYYFLLCYYGS